VSFGQRVYLSAVAAVGALVAVWLAIAVHDSAFAVSKGYGAVALAVDFLGEPVGSALVMAGLVAATLPLRSWRWTALAVVGPGVTVVLTTVVKPLVGRTINGPHLSYPSGHTAYAAAVGLVAALLLARRFGGFVPLTILVPAGCAAAMAWAQVSLGAHYVTDTVGGYATALAVTATAALLLLPARLPAIPR
jgi:membrane-associated phospholipid phosphatase